MKSLKYLFTASALILVPFLANAQGNNRNCPCQNGQGNGPGWKQGSPGQGNRGQRGPGQRGNGMRMFNQALQQLDLSTEQQTKVDNTLTAFRDSSITCQSEMREARQILQDLRDENAQETEEYKEALLLVDSFQQAGIARRQTMRDNLMEILTEDQQLQFIDIMEQSMPRGRKNW